MKIKRLNPETLPQGVKGANRSKTPRVAFETTGVVSFNPPAQVAMDCKAGDSIEFVYDAEGGGYSVTKSENGFVSRLKGDKKQICFTSSALKREVFDTLKFEGKSHSFKIKPEPVKQKGFVNPLFELDTVIV